MQRSANNACLAEAKAAMNGAVAEIAVDGEIKNGYTPAACNTGSGAKLAVGTKDLGTDKIIFDSKTRGTSSERKNASCDPVSATCELVSP